MDAFDGAMAIDDERVCRRCYALDTWMLYRKARPVCFLPFPANIPAGRHASRLPPFFAPHLRRVAQAGRSARPPRCGCNSRVVLGAADPLPSSHARGTSFKAHTTLTRICERSLQSSEPLPCVLLEAGGSSTGSHPALRMFQLALEIAPHVRLSPEQDHKRERSSRNRPPRFSTCVRQPVVARTHDLC
jgi:hypothetical protein